MLSGVSKDYAVQSLTAAPFAHLAEPERCDSHFQIEAVVIGEIVLEAAGAKTRVAVGGLIFRRIGWNGVVNGGSATCLSQLVAECLSVLTPTQPLNRPVSSSSPIE